MAIENAVNNRRTRPKIAINSVFDCHLSPIGLQMTIENSVSNFFDLRSSKVLTFSIATYLVYTRISLVASFPGHTQYYLLCIAHNVSV